MIIGAHAILYTTNADADRAFFRDVLRFPNVDVGGGWLIFGLPPSEVAVHPAENGEETHELYLMCDDVEATVTELAAKGVAASEINDQGWGRVTMLTIADGVRLGLYEPRHPVALGL